MTDLDRLIDAVEAGDAPWREIATISFVCGPQIAPWRRTVGEAYQGSLDAAKALHEALLPGWKVATVGQSDDGSWWCELRRGHITSYDNVSISPLKCETPDRAWLLAILRAYRATQEQKDG